MVKKGVTLREGVSGMKRAGAVAASATRAYTLDVSPACIDTGMGSGMASSAQHSLQRSTSSWQPRAPQVSRGQYERVGWAGAEAMVVVVVDGTGGKPRYAA